jgi:hypothetical protein
VQRRVKFVPDIVDKETLRPAAVIWQQGFGDCDDINAVLLPSLLMTVGFPTRLVTIACDSEDFSQFSHIYAETEINGAWIPVDLARPGARFGRDPGYHERRHVWSLVDGEHYEDSPASGLGFMGDDLSDLGPATDQSGPLGLGLQTTGVVGPLLLLLLIGGLAFVIANRD